jgi:hypothetical protein
MRLTDLTSKAHRGKRKTRSEDDTVLGLVAILCQQLVMSPSPAREVQAKRFSIRLISCGSIAWTCEESLC